MEPIAASRCRTLTLETDRPQKKIFRVKQTVAGWLAETRERTCLRPRQRQRERTDPVPKQDKHPLRRIGLVPTAAVTQTKQTDSLEDRQLLKRGRSEPTPANGMHRSGPGQRQRQIRQTNLVLEQDRQLLKLVPKAVSMLTERRM